MSKLEQSEDEKHRRYYFTKDNIWMVWGILALVFFFLFAIAFEKHYHQDKFYIFMTPKIYLTARLMLGVYSSFLAFNIKQNKITKIEFELKLWFYLITCFYFLFSVYYCIYFDSFYFSFPPVLYYFTFLLSVKTLKVFGYNKGLSTIQLIFQTDLIRLHWKEFVIKIILLSSVFVGLNYLIEFIITRSNLV